MNIVDVRHIEDCFDGSYLYEILFDTEITSTFIEALGTEGRLQYHRDFARPFFKAVFNGRFTIKGVEGNTSVRLLAFDKNLAPTLDCIRHFSRQGSHGLPQAGGNGAEHDTDARANNLC